jgi:anti-sigma regulatory factor (Ser/Thr protein kinase)
VTSLPARVPADLDALGRVRSNLAEALQREGWSKEPARRVLTASTEALANAFAYGLAPGAGVDVTFQVSVAAAAVRVLDLGRRHREEPPADLDPPPVTATHGRGRLLMRGLADDVQVRPLGHGTELLLRFRAE